MRTLEHAHLIEMTAKPAAIVKSFTGDVLLPSIGLALGGVDFVELATAKTSAAGYGFVSQPLFRVS